MKIILQSCLYSALATIGGLSATLVVGRFSWATGSGVSGIAIGFVVACVLALLLRFQFRLITSVVASSLGAAVACFFAISTAELLPAGSTEWMLKGGLYGVCWGLPITFLLGPIGILENISNLPSPYRSIPEETP